jgi:hypothetical protein
MTKIEEIWRDALQQAKTKPIKADRFRLTRIERESRFDIYAGVDAASFLLLAIGIQVRPPSITTDASAFDYFRQQRKDGSWLMVLRLRRDGLESVFGRLCQDLVDAAEGVADENALVIFFRERLNLWKELFQNGEIGFLQTHEIKGLIAEMLVLELLLRGGRRNAYETVSGWVGPLGADQDFIYAERAIEVKAVGLGADSISIASLEQLDCKVLIHLILATLRTATPGERGAIGLNTLAARIEGIIAESSDALIIFKKRLLEARYVEHEFYETVLFEPISIVAYSILDTFPKLIRNMVSASIVSASYSIGINSIANFKSEMPT